MIQTPASPAARPGHGLLCAIFAVDIAGFTRPDRDDDTRLHLRKAVYEMLEEAFGDCGIPWDTCDHSDTGDGALVAIPLTLPPAHLTGPVPERLRHLIRQHNKMSSDTATIQLRAAASIGQAYRDRHGLTGDEVNLVFRMLQTRPLRQALTGPETELALMISQYMHDFLDHCDPSLASTAMFRPVKARVKRMRIRGWLYAPGSPEASPR